MRDWHNLLADRPALRNSELLAPYLLAQYALNKGLFVLDRRKVFAYLASKLLDNCISRIDVEASEQNQIDAAKFELQRRLQNAEYFEAAQLFIMLGERNKDLGFFIEGVKCFLLANCYHAARDLAVELCDAGVAEKSPSLMKMFALATALSGSDEQAKILLQIVLTNEPDCEWAERLLSENESLCEALVNQPYFKANIHNAVACSRANRVQIISTLSCEKCATHYNTSTMHTVFRINFAPCPSCLRPYVIAPSSIRDALWKFNPKHDEPKAMALDALLARWVLGLARPEAPESARVWGANLLDLTYFTNRFELGEVYARMHAAECSSEGRSR